VILECVGDFGVCLGGFYFDIDSKKPMKRF